MGFEFASARAGETTAALVLMDKNKIRVTNIGNGMWDLSLHRSATLLSYNICVTNVGMWDLSLHRFARTGEMTATLILSYNKIYVASVGMWVMC